MSVQVLNAPLLINSFTTYQLSGEQQLQGSILTPLQAMLIHNLLTGIAEEKIGLKFDPNNIYQFAQREAELTGQIGILRYLLDASESVSLSITPVSFNNDTINNPTEI